MNEQISAESESPRLEAVTAVPWYDGDQPPWPWLVARLQKFTFFQLSGETSPHEVGLLVGEMLDHARGREEIDDALIVPSTEPSELIERLINVNYLCASGGIRVIASGEVTEPGCCAALESWWEWRQFRDGDQELAIGHDPCLTARRVNSGISVSTDDPEQTPVLFSEIQFREALDSVQRDLREFLPVLRGWVANLGFQKADEFAEKFDRDFAINHEYPTYWLTGD
jgi:hypothetical protein